MSYLGSSGEFEPMSCNHQANATSAAAVEKASNLRATDLTAVKISFECVLDILSFSACLWGSYPRVRTRTYPEISPRTSVLTSSSCSRAALGLGMRASRMAPTRMRCIHDYDV